MDLRVGCDFSFELPVEAEAIVMVEPHGDPGVHVRSARFSTLPAVGSWAHVDRFGNRVRRMSLPSGGVTVAFEAVVTVTDQPDAPVLDLPVRTPGALPPDALEFLLPSRYCESDVLVGEVLRRFGGAPPDGRRVQDICDWVHDHLRFDYGSSAPTHTAASVYAGGAGVCRDFTHLAIAMCRALNVPSRYVCGYLPDIGVPDPGTPMDFCAWMEVYLGDRWCTFDPRNNVARAGRVVIARGRDAADVAMVTTFGQATLRAMTVVAEAASAIDASVAVGGV